jgi:hypothetical protein
VTLHGSFAMSGDPSGLTSHSSTMIE